MSFRWSALVRSVTEDDAVYGPSHVVDIVCYAHIYPRFHLQPPHTNTPLFKDVLHTCSVQFIPCLLSLVRFVKMNKSDFNYFVCM